MTDPAAYVAAVAPTLGFSFTPEQQAQVAAALVLVASIAAPALARTLPPDTEPAPVFAP
jgi:hypothetical protein